MNVILKKQSLRIAFVAVVGITLSSCEKKSPITKPTAEKNETQEPERNYFARAINTPVLFSALPAYEELTGLKIIVSESVDDASTFTVDSQKKLSREEMIKLYNTCFKEQGFKISQVNDTTVLIEQTRRANTDSVDANKEPTRRRKINEKTARVEQTRRVNTDNVGTSKEPTRRRRMAVLPPAKPSPRSGSNNEPELFTTNCIQCSVIDLIMPTFGKLVKKKILADDSVGKDLTMTINTQKKMDRDEVIQFYKDSFRLNRYTFTPIDEQTWRLSKKASAE